MFARSIRIVRTPSSERHILLDDKRREFAALELHYLPDGKVAGTLILFEDSKYPEAQVPALLEQIDDELLPEASLSAHNLSFTVVVGRVLGSFVPDTEESAK